MKIAYIAHPIAGDVEKNLADIRRIVCEINLTRSDVVPFVPYYSDVVSMDETDPSHRERGIKNDHEIITRRFIDEMWLYGETISPGMRKEIVLAHQNYIHVVPKTKETQKEYDEMIADHLRENSGL